MLDPINSPDERLTVRNFLAIKQADISVSRITVFIGPQASGKSILAKVLYFCRDFFDDLFQKYVPSNEDRRSFNNSKSIDFYQLFPGADGEALSFNINYFFGGYSIELEKLKGNRKLKIKLSKNLVSLVNKVKVDFRRSIAEVDVSRSYLLDQSIFHYLRSNKEASKFYNSLPAILHVPASRAFFSTLQSNVFTFLSESDSIDPLLVAFGRFFEVSKRIYGRDPLYYRRSEKEKKPKSFKNIIKGEFVREKDDDLIQTEWGLVKLQNSSSGQQEALPLLLALEVFPQAERLNEMLIIEEPEAHLFPLAQKAILEQIVETSVTRKCSVVITTHSPYIIACINNEIHRRDGSFSVSGYYVADGTAEAIYDTDLCLLDIEKIDEVSEEIASDFIKATN